MMKKIVFKKGDLVPAGVFTSNKPFLALWGCRVEHEIGTKEYKAKKDKWFHFKKIDAMVYLYTSPNTLDQYINGHGVMLNANNRTVIGVKYVHAESLDINELGEK